MADPDDLGALRERVAALEEEVAAHERRARDVNDEHVVRLEQQESRGDWLERMLEWYADLYEFAPTAFLSLDASGLIRDINLTGAALLQIPRQRLIGRPLRLHIVPADRRLLLEHIRRCRAERGQVLSELRLLRADGSDLPVQLLSREDGASLDYGSVSYRSVIFDLSEHKRIEGALRLGHQRLSLALAASEAGLHEYRWPVGALSIEKCPPRPSTRSCTLRRPKPLDSRRRVSRRPGLKPWPSSSISMWRCRSWPWSRTTACAAPACLMTLSSSSRTQRNSK